MTREEKQLLTKDICARIPYDLKVNYADKVYDVLGYTNNKLIIVLPFMSNLEGHPVDTCKPYLRPIESITEEEKDKLRKLLWFGYPSDDYDINAHRGIEIASVLHDTWKNAEFDFEEFNDLQDFLNSIHIDYRGLIPIGLALPAQEGMYND